MVMAVMMEVKPQTQCIQMIDPHRRSDNASEQKTPPNDRTAQTAKTVPPMDRGTAQTMPPNDWTAQKTPPNGSNRKDSTPNRLNRKDSAPNRSSHKDATRGSNRKRQCPQTDRTAQISPQTEMPPNKRGEKEERCGIQLTSTAHYYQQKY
jgi:hypothetical protein